MTSTIEKWDSNPMRCFKDFVLSMDFIETSPRMLDRDFNKPISAQSAETYLLMFGKFTRWLAGQGKRFSAVNHYDLLMFLELGTVIGTKRVPDLKSKITYRYLRLIERCYIYLQVHPNPAQHAIFDAVRGQKIGRDKEMVVLSTDQLHQFVSALPFSANTSHWKRRRDRSMQLVMLFAGLKVAEAIGLMLKEIARQVELNGSLKLSITPELKHSTSYEHDTFLHPNAVHDVLAWVREREGMLIPGGRLFPANLKGDAIDKATVYRQVKATFKRAKIEIPRSGGRTLRNTFAVQEIKNGVEPAVLTTHLGLALERSTETYTVAEAKTT